MQKWITVTLAILVFIALLLAASRWWLPLFGLAGAGNEVLQPLEGLTPWLVWFIVAISALLAVNLRWETFWRKNRPRRLIDEAEAWSDSYRIGLEADSNALTDKTDGQRSLLDSIKTFTDAPQSETVISERIFDSQGTVAFAPDLPVAHTNGNGIAPVVADKPEVEYALANVPQLEDISDEEYERSRITLALPDEPDIQVVALTPVNSTAFNDQHELVITPWDIASAATQAQAESVHTYHQLPPVPEAFAGREYELTELIESLDNDQTTMVGLWGIGGAGKTALALKLAHELAERYPDAQLYLDLKGTSSRALSVIEAQSHVIRAYHPDAKLPESDAHLRGVYESTLNDKRVLLLFDNVTNAQQLEALAPPPGSLVIVTARQLIELPGLDMRQLDVLPATDAETLLTTLVPRAAEQAERIARQCGYLPMALRLAANALAQRPELTPSTYSSKLAQVAQRLQTDGAPRPIETALTLSYELLSPGLQKLWRTLAVFPDSFDIAGAAALWGLHPERATKALKRLMELDLLEASFASGRYRLHDLKRSFADKQLIEPDRSECQQSHAEYYQSVLHEADALYEQGGDALQVGLQLVDSEWHNLEAGQRWAVTNAETNRAARELCSSYPDAGRNVLDLRQHPRERIRWCEAALAASHRLKRRKSECRHLLAMGRAYITLSELHHALDCYDQALTIARETNDKHGEARALNGVGAAYLAGNALGDARKHHSEALAVARSFGDQRNEAAALGGLGMAHYAAGELPHALKLLEQQLAFARQLGDKRGEAQAWGGLGLAHYAQGAARKAIEALEQQLRLAREIGDRRGEAQALSTLGHACTELNDHDRAIAFHEQSLFITREISDRRNEAAALGGIGVAWYLKGDTARSLEYLEQQLQLARDIKDERNEALALGNLGEAYITLNQPDRAIEALQRSFELSTHIEDSAGQGYALYQLALVYHQRGEQAQALVEASAALELFQIAESSYADAVKEKLAEWSDVSAGAGS
jgi:tetratricopeptide (TPR) repeat protein